MKSLAVLFLIVFGAVASQAFAQDTIPQPLTRADCEAASGWSWNETANVCDANAKDRTPTLDGPDISLPASYSLCRNARRANY